MRQVNDIIEEDNIHKNDIHKVEIKDVINLFKNPVEKITSISYKKN